MNVRNRDSCRQSFKNLNILVLKLQYIFFLIFVAENINLYESNSGIYNIDTRFSSDLHTPTANLTTFQKGPFYFGIKIFNHLPTSIKKTSHDKPIQIRFKKFSYYKFILLFGEIFCLEFQ
jgi:hypothetical protein